METTERRLENATKLITLTSDEAARWRITVATLSGQIENLFGDIFMSSACISYNGPFTGVFRKDLVENWYNATKENKIPLSETFSTVAA